MCPKGLSKGAVWPCANEVRIGANWRMDHVRIRPIRPSDEDALMAFYSGLSDGARCARFLGIATGLDEDRAKQMSAAHGLHEAGFVAEEMGGADGRIVGHVSLSDVGTDVAEIAIAVADRCQHQGVGRHLFLAATRWAEANGCHSIVATAFTDNWRVIHLLRCSGHATIVRDAGCGVTSITISIDDRPNATSDDWRGGGLSAPGTGSVERIPLALGYISRGLCATL